MINKLIKTPGKRDLIQVSKPIKIRENPDGSPYFNFRGFKIYLSEVTRFGCGWLPTDDTLPEFIHGLYCFGMDGLLVEIIPGDEQIRLYKEV